MIKGQAGGAVSGGQGNHSPADGGETQSERACAHPGHQSGVQVIKQRLSPVADGEIDRPDAFEDVSGIVAVPGFVVSQAGRH